MSSPKRSDGSVDDENDSPEKQENRHYGENAPCIVASPARRVLPRPPATEARPRQAEVSEVCEGNDRYSEHDLDPRRGLRVRGGQHDSTLPRHAINFVSA